MKNKVDVALEKFMSGYNCAQAVLFVHSGDLGLEANAALKLACGFGAGMGRKEEVCGAVSGGIMVIGADYGCGEGDGRAANENENAYSKTRELLERFQSGRGSYICRELLDGCDLTTEEGQRHCKQNDLVKKDLQGMREERDADSRGDRSAKAIDPYHGCRNCRSQFALVLK